jgi:signal peptidase II
VSDRTRWWAALAAIAALVVALDQWTKAEILAGLGPGAATHRVQMGPPWLALEYAENRGVAFGLLGSTPWLAATMAAVIAAGITWYVARRPPGAVLLLGAALTIGGAIGNLLDRARHGFVVDFVAIGAWPNFNVADAAICGGVLLLALEMALQGPTSESATERSDAG